MWYFKSKKGIYATNVSRYPWHCITAISRAVPGLDDLRMAHAVEVRCEEKELGIYRFNEQTGKYEPVEVRQGK
ncbi:hypothetical protein D6833_08680 [Candidatus Parcubacteria bacterium]|nr:MAG: hypothetical protein D6833_08680 [Candidatus Parcubacteria bacterium]